MGATHEAKGAAPAAPTPRQLIDKAMSEIKGHLVEMLDAVDDMVRQFEDEACEAEDAIDEARADAEDWRGQSQHVRQLADEAIAAAFRRVGPPDERLCDWRKCIEEPWASLHHALPVVRA